MSATSSDRPAVSNNAGRLPNLIQAHLGEQLADGKQLLRLNELLKQAPELTHIGGGINMGPNAVRILRGLGLAAGLDREGNRPLFTHQRRWQDGRTLQRAPLNPLCEELYGAPHMTLHRADLLDVIASGFPAEYEGLAF